MAVSSDGVVTAVAAANASVSLDINWPAAAGTMPWLTTVTRTVAGVEVRVRSGDNAFSPGGVVHVHDNGAPLEGLVTYRAFGYDGNAQFFRMSVAVNLTLPPVTSTVWLKSVANPSLSMRLPFVLDKTESWGQRQETFLIPGRSNPVVWQDVQQGMTGDLICDGMTRADFVGLRALAGSGVLLLQGSAADVSWDHDTFLVISNVGVFRNPLVYGWALRTFTLPYVEVDRPSTAGAPLTIAGWTNDVAAASYATYTAFDATINFPTYLAQSKGP